MKSRNGRCNGCREINEIKTIDRMFHKIHRRFKSLLRAGSQLNFDGFKRKFFI